MPLADPEARRAYDRMRSPVKNKAYYAANKEREAARCKAYRENHKDEMRAKARAAYRRDLEYNIARSREYTKSEQGQEVRRKWRAANASRQKEAQARWAKENASHVRAKVAARRAMKNKATPSFADLAVIESIYEDARRLSKETGVPHEVDHIVPLKGRTVCGLHVSWNLRVVTRHVNRSKNNRMVEA